MNRGSGMVIVYLAAALSGFVLGFGTAALLSWLPAHALHAVLSP